MYHTSGAKEGECGREGKETFANFAKSKNRIPRARREIPFWWAIKVPVSVTKVTGEARNCGVLPLVLTVLDDAKKAPPHKGAAPFWWAIKGSNLGPTGYEPVALTN